jgi:hypothetical protein
MVRNPRKEDNSILHAKMQNQRLWQMSSRYKSLQKITVSSIQVDPDTASSFNAKLTYSQENLDRTRKFLAEASQEKLTNRNVKYF